MEVRENIPLAPYTTFKIGGPARFFIEADSREELDLALAFAREKKLKLFVLGGGSNLLVSDAGFDGLVVRIKTSGISFEEKENHTAVTAETGESWDGLVGACVARGLWGIENLSGIPGTVGGACVQNIGAYGAALSQTLLSVDVLDARTWEALALSKEECAFGYRESIFKKEPGRYVVLRASFALSKIPAPNFSYKDLAQRFAGTAPDIEAVRNAVLEIRKNKFPDLSVEGTAGSFFKNPIVSAADAERIAARYPGMPLFSLPESAGKKVPLAWLLDFRNGALDMRGISAGGARLFERQPLVIAAARNTPASDVVDLSRLMQQKIKSECGIDIEPEVHILA